MPRDYFYPRPLRGGRPACSKLSKNPKKISIHALCEEGDASFATGSAINLISIHALCEEGDPTIRRGSVGDVNNFYPRPLRGGRPPKGSHRKEETGDFYPRPLRGGRPEYSESNAGAKEFLSTPSARRATAVSCRMQWRRKNFYPRPLRGGRPTTAEELDAGSEISIHALCEEGDLRRRQRTSRTI